MSETHSAAESNRTKALHGACHACRDTSHSPHWNHHPPHQKNWQRDKRSPLSEKRIFLNKFLKDTSPFLSGHCYPCFGLLVTSALGFKARVDPLFACFLTCMQWMPQIHLWSNTYRRLGGQHGSRVPHMHVTEVACHLETFINWSSEAT